MKAVWSKTVTSLAALVGFIPAASAFMVIHDPVRRVSRVETVVTPRSDGVYEYSYTVYNDSEPTFVMPNGAGEIWPLIIGWEIPLDSPDVVWEVTFPDTWGYRFLSAEEYLQEYGVSNPFDSLYVLQWYDQELFWEISTEKTIAPEGYNEAFNEDEYEPFATGFGFLSRLAPVDGPYSAIWWDHYREIGDPPLPGGTFGGGLPYTRRHAMPEGGTTLILLGLGLAGLQFSRRLR